MWLKTLMVFWAFMEKLRLLSCMDGVDLCWCCRERVGTEEPTFVAVVMFKLPTSVTAASAMNGTTLNGAYVGFGGLLWFFGVFLYCWLWCGLYWCCYVCLVISYCYVFLWFSWDVALVGVYVFEVVLQLVCGLNGLCSVWLNGLLIFCFDCLF